MIPATKCAVELAFPGVIACTVDMARTVGNGDVGVVGVVGRVSGRSQEIRRFSSKSVKSFIIEWSLSKEFWS